MWCTNLAYSISAVISNYTDSDILDGMVMVMVISYFCGLGKIHHHHNRHICKLYL